MVTETLYPIKKLIRLTPEQAERIRVFRFGEMIGSELEAIRRLIDLGLDAAEKQSAKRPSKSRRT